MNNIILLSSAVSADWKIIIEYIIYAVIIAVSIILLIALRKRTRLPKHGELKKRLVMLHADITALKSPEQRLKFFKNVSRTVYKADNLAFTAAMLAEKERYSDLNKIASLTEEARGELWPYKYSKKEPEQHDGIDAAADKITQAIAAIDKVIERDKKLNRKK